MTVSRIPGVAAPVVKRVVKDAEETEADVRYLYFNATTLLTWVLVPGTTIVEQEGTRQTLPFPSETRYSSWERCLVCSVKRNGMFRCCNLQYRWTTLCARLICDSGHALIVYQVSLYPG